MHHLIYPIDFRPKFIFSRIDNKKFQLTWSYAFSMSNLYTWFKVAISIIDSKDPKAYRFRHLKSISDDMQNMLI